MALNWTALYAALVMVWSAALCFGQSIAGGCGEVVTIQTHGRTTTRYALSRPQGEAADGVKISLVLLAGGGGHIDLDDKGCPRALVGNSLVRSVPLFNRAGFVTALVDAPTDYHRADGLAGIRIVSEHANDLGKVIADLRARVNGPVWVIGTSRGTISAVNAGARLSGAAAPDGLVLTSALISGERGDNRFTESEHGVPPSGKRFRLQKRTSGNYELWSR
ncbi:MAG: hypothetical protein FJ143_07320 [Deltaproteobacteria bacterium]|nr:hypothetical protein [Deltaproteobacteria bacterium]